MDSLKNKDFGSMRDQQYSTYMVGIDGGDIRTDSEARSPYSDLKYISNEDEKEVNPHIPSSRDPVNSYVWQQGKQHVQKAYTMFSNIDILRPYFNVEPMEVKERLVTSLIPSFPFSNKPVLIGELYGPLMIVFTLIALLLYGMKTSGHIVKEGTLMGTAFAVCFGYWLGGGLSIYFIAHICSVQISYLQTLSLMGYALFGHCIALFLGTIIHPESSHAFFYIVWIIFGGLSAFRMITVLLVRITGRSQQFIILSSIAILHMLFLLFLHFAYHSTVEALDRLEI